MEIKVIKFCDTTFAEAQLEKAGDMFNPPEKFTRKIRQPKNGPAYHDDYECYSMATSRGYFYLRKDEVTNAMEQYIQVGDEVEFTTLTPCQYGTSVLVSFCNLTQGIKLINSKMQQLADFIEQETCKSADIYMNMLTNMKQDDYLILLVHCDGHRYRNLVDMATATSLSKKDEGVRKLFARNRDEGIIIPAQMHLGNHICDDGYPNNRFELQIVQYNAAEDEFVDDTTFYYSLRDIFTSQRINTELFQRDTQIQFETL